jgi:hypothetical protein
MRGFPLYFTCRSVGRISFPTSAFSVPVIISRVGPTRDSRPKSRTRRSSFTNFLPQSMSEVTESQPLLAHEGSQVELVSWEGKEDQHNPRCFPTRQKGLILFILFSVAILSYLPMDS